MSVIQVVVPLANEASDRIGPDDYRRFKARVFILATNIRAGLYRPCEKPA